ncbi:MAG: hypothetical protein KAR51_04205 [Candidatus Aenigmarchaeota archaeon]|nr:hypothetical protein [Candidatus Aenigmarchaeota archaeon]
MVDKVSMPKMDGNITGLYALKDFVKSQQPILVEELVKEYAGVLEKYIEDHEDYIGGRLYSTKKRLSGHPKILDLKPTFKIDLTKGNYNNYWAKLFSKSIKKTMPEWTGLLMGDIDVVYSALNDIKDNNSAFLKNFDNIDIAAEAGISEDLKEMEKYYVDESLFSIYKEDISFALNRYNESLQALVEHMSEVGVDTESTEEAADALKGSIAESNKIFGVIGDSEDRKDVLQGALLLEEYLDEIQETVNVCLTDTGDDFKFHDNHLINLDASSIMGMLYRLKNLYTNGQEFKERALEYLGYEIEGVDSVNPYASTKVAVRENKK